MDALRSILLSSTDAVVLIEFIVVIGLAILIGWLVRRRSEYLMLTIGVTVLLLGLMSVRAIH